MSCFREARAANIVPNNFRAIASAIQTCQCEKKPVWIGNVSVQARSAVTRHKPKTNTIADAGVSNATKIPISCRFQASRAVATVCCSKVCVLPRNVELVSATAVAVRTQAGCNINPILVTDISETLSLLNLMHETGQSFGNAHS
jgi:hypothetical protein